MTITAITVVQGLALQPGPKGDPGEQGPPGSIGSIDVARGWTTLQYIAPSDLAIVSGSVAWDTAAHQSARLALASGATAMSAPTNVVDGAYYALRMVQPTGTPGTLTWDTHYHWPGGAPGGVPTLSTPNGAIDVFHFRGAVGNVLEFVGAQMNIKA